MDNDDFRRGKPSCHKQFGEEYALLAGDGLLTLAFETALSEDNDITFDNIIKAARLLANLAGVAGMVGGQVLDLQSEGSSPSLEKLCSIDRLKTGALIKAACLLGCYAANKTDESTLKSAEIYAECIGHAFQIVDDILDVTSDSETLGKPVGSDIKNDKITYVSFMGIDNAQKEVDRLTNEAINALSVFGEDTQFLKDFALKLSKRNK
jgi:geranylgeranyl diphosphate synthase type II